MKTRVTPTDDEILMASGKKKFDDLCHAEYSMVIEAQAAGIKEAFAKQQAKAVVCSVYYLISFSVKFTQIFIQLGALESSKFRETFN
jgi:hypothetical protein